MIGACGEVSASASALPTRVARASARLAGPGGAVAAARGLSSRAAAAAPLVARRRAAVRAAASVARLVLA